jgi:Uma2 family endonuclease
MAPKEALPVSTTTKKKPWTADELSRLPKLWRYEIDEGELVIMSPAGRRHSRILMATGALLRNFVHAHKLGEVVGGEFGVYLQREPQTLRGIDVAFYSSERVKQMGDDDKGFPDVPPDLAVEIHLPDERDMQRKVVQYLAAGVRSVWVIDPDARTLAQHRPGKAPRMLADPEMVVEESVLPGFACRLRELFGEE